MTQRRFRVVALIASYNEERFIGPCIEHLLDQGVEVYLIDNESTDRTVAAAEAYLGNGLIGIETLERQAEFSLTAQLERKEELAAAIDADWFIHCDADEFRLPPPRSGRLVDAFAEVDVAGYNAVNFQEFAFVPTIEEPDHDHRDFQATMRHYYPFLPWFPHQVKAWKRQDEKVQLTTSGGHNVRFPGVRRFPTSFAVRHYLFLSSAHARQKYSRVATVAEQQMGWGGWRITVAKRGVPGPPPLPRQAELREYVGDDELDPTEPLTQHVWAEEWARQSLARSAGEPE
jgi:glycosyltransferase involved in cell wall biosynthesis